MPIPRPLVHDFVAFLAIVAVGVCLVPAGAHLCEMVAKLSLPQIEYMVVQRIYAGWALFGVAIFAALALILLQVVLFWRYPAVRWLSLAAWLAMGATQVIFWRYTYPMNAASGNWTTVPPDFEAARQQWEYSHAANAGLTFLAFCLLVVALIASARDPDITSDGIVFRRP